MWQETLLDATSWIEPILAGLFIIAGILFFIWSRIWIRKDSFPQKDSLLERIESSLSLPRQEYLYLSLIVIVALLMRIVGWNDGLNAPFYASQTTALYVDLALEQGDLWDQWLKLFRNGHTIGTSWPHDSPIVMPVSIVFQMIFDPHFHLPVIIGAFWGVNSVFLAWLLGREIHSKLFGILFASFVAVSPLQLIWSRIGGIYITGSTYVLLVLCCAYLAGKRRNYLLAIMTGVLSWGSLYMYHPARVAIPLALIALFSGLITTKTGLFKKITLLLCVLLTFCSIYILLNRERSLKQAFWPQYGGYTGNKGEATLRELLEKNAYEVRRQFFRSIDHYFIRDRTVIGDTNTPFKWGMQYGGLCFLPVAVLGFIGLGYTIIFYKKHFLWFFLAGAGLAVTSLSLATARRFIVFDVAWCGFTAYGLIFLLNTRGFQNISVRAAGIMGSLLLIGLGSWSFGSMVLLNGILPHHYGAPIPFGDGGFGDGITCLRCFHASYEWQEEIEKKNFVILFDTDLYRENRTSPGGLALYGKVAALAAGRKENFIEFYPVVQNFDIEPPVNARNLYDVSQTDFTSYLINRINTAQPAHLIWHFEKPTQWELWLAEQLVAAGGVFSTFETALSDTPGIQVRTAWSQRQQTFDILQKLQEGIQEQNQECREAALIDTYSHHSPPILMAAPGFKSDDAMSEWLVGSWPNVTYKGEVFPSSNTVAASIEKNGDSNNEKIHVLTAYRYSTMYNFPQKERQNEHIPGNDPIGYGCATYIASHWWIVDPVSGKLSTTYQPTEWIPEHNWIGIAQGEDDEILLASASQKIYVLDLEQQKLIKEFPASVWPSRQWNFGECASIFTGEDWYAVFNHLPGTLSVYAADGQHVTTNRLDTLLNINAQWISTLIISEQYLGVGMRNTEIRTFRFNVSQLCNGESTQINQPGSDGTP